MHVNEIKSEFGDLAGSSKVTVEVGPDDNKKELKLDMTVDDLHPFMVMGEGKTTEEDAKKMTNVLRTVLYRSYLPHWDDARDQEPTGLADSQEKDNEEAKEYLEQILLKYAPDILVGISEDLGWQDDVDEAALRRQQMGK